MSAEDLDVLGFSLPRPLAGAVVHGPCRRINVSELKFPLPAGGMLLAIHAQDAWRAADVEAVTSLWPPCPADEKRHPRGLVGVGLVRGVEWIPANGPAAEDPWSLGPWAIELQDVVAFKSPAALVGYPGLFKIPDALASKIATAWTARPLENGRRHLASFPCPLCREERLFTGEALAGKEGQPQLDVVWDLGDTVGLCAKCGARVRHRGDFVEHAVELNAAEWRGLSALERWAAERLSPEAGAGPSAPSDPSAPPTGAP